MNYPSTKTDLKNAYSITMTNHHIDLQIVCKDSIPVTEELLLAWVTKTLDEEQAKASELTLRLVDTAEIKDLNSRYRKQDKATNVLAFPSNIPAQVVLDHAFLGDIIICPSVLAEEALESEVPLEAHWAHIVIHGVLHLLGYDHIEDRDTTIMQAKEVNILAQLGFANPYQLETLARE